MKDSSLVRMFFSQTNCCLHSKLNWTFLKTCNFAGIEPATSGYIPQCFASELGRWCVRGMFINCWLYMPGFSPRKTKQRGKPFFFFFKLWFLCKKSLNFLKIRSLKNCTDIIPDYYIHANNNWLVFPHELQGLSVENIRDNKPWMSEWAAEQLRRSEPGCVME